MAKRTVQDLILQELTELRSDVKKISTETIPTMMTDITKVTERVKSEAKSTVKIYSMIWGGITLLISCVGVAVAYFKH